jgi:hypothetical protein
MMLSPYLMFDGFAAVSRPVNIVLRAGLEI